MIIKILLTVVIADLLAQTIKLFVNKHRTGNIDFKIMLSDGGMPSAHSAIVASLTTLIYYYDGLSLLFVITLFFSLIVLRDATGVRRSAGRQAEVLNQLIHKEGIKVKKLKELIGHTPLQVIMGVLLGIVIASVSYWTF